MRNLFIFLLVLFYTSKSFAVVTIDITRGNLEPLPTAVSNFYVDNPEQFPEKIKKLKLEENLPKVIKGNLMRSGLFYVLDNKSYIQK
ncbi:MAG: Tol-Pal system protein TolB, partial [Pelagibacteraceae bacterium]